MTNKTLIDFIKTDLGCQCPDEVFSKIEKSIKPVHQGDISGLHRVLVGERLLIYIVAVCLHDLQQPFLKEMVSTGKADRDKHGYNRFRLVIIAPDSNLTVCKQRLQEEFKTIAFDDAKLHLHVIAAEQAPAEFQAGARFIT